MHVDAVDLMSLSGCFIHHGGPHLSVPSGQSAIWDWLSPPSPWQQHFKTRHLIAGVKQQQTHCAKKLILSFQQVHSSHEELRSVFFLCQMNKLMIINGTAAKFPSVCCIIYFFKLLTFPCSLTSTHPLTALLPFPCSLFYKL